MFKPKSDWVPKEVHHTVATFCEAIKTEMKKPTNEKVTYNNNLTKK